MDVRHASVVERGDLPVLIDIIDHFRFLREAGCNVIVHEDAKQDEPPPVAVGIGGRK
jgi:hypothetical protein